MNDFYNVTGWPGQGAPGDSASGRTELSNIQTGFNKLAPITGNALKLIRNNASATAQEAVTPATATLETYADAQAGTHNILTTVAGTNTITATATPTLAAYVTNQPFQFAAAGANTGATTIAIDGLAAKNLVRPDGSALLAGDILGVGYECQIVIRAADAVLMNPVNQARAAVAPWSGITGKPISAVFVSMDTLMTANSTTIAPHGLGAVPIILKAYLVCSVIEAGYSVGDIVDVSTQGTGAQAGGVAANAVSILYVAKGTPYVLNLSTQTATPITIGNWNLRLVAMI